ncbi:MAG: DUF3772 domain-containing protein [Gluconobacter cerinus]|uniref:DUF3772 domain-containing protein n=1 Tax=Gluconobacter TaxID=441 RepID=UPI000A3CD74F|nr:MULTISPECIES: DUF3772 domain-containing protein [Gluconobacter]MBS1036690.1 DUF3772 domain-containing protein [Gluconobacter cerinus]MCW2265925.1 small-conductance mechanosensitive channel [Gluconobacter cerinus]OUJ09221.1 hypothetical protein HK24_00195 [Gluconobacter sp. DsW_058]
MQEPHLTGPETRRRTRFTCRSAFLALTLLCGVPITGHAAPAAAPQAAAPTTTQKAVVDKNGGLGWTAVSDTINRQLEDSSATLKQILNVLNRTDANLGSTELDNLSARAQRVQQNTQDALTQIQNYDDITDSYLQILGPKAAENEDPSVTEQRARLQQNSQGVKSALMRSKLYNLQAKQLNSAIATRRTRLQNAALSERTVSPLAPKFWHALLTERPENKSSLHEDGVLSAWMMLLIGTAGTLFLIGIASPVILRLLKRAGAKFRSSAETGVKDALASSIIAITLNGILCALLGGITWLIWSAAVLDADGGPIAAVLGESLPICGFIIGAGLPVFGRKGVLEGNPNERRALRGVDWMLALSILVLNLLRSFRAQDVFGPTLQTVLEMAFSLAIGICAIDTFRRLGKQDDTRQFAPTALGLSSLIFGISLIAVLLGYVSFAFSLNGWLLSLGTGLAVVVLLGLCWRSILDHLFDPEGRFSARLHPLGLSSRRLTQIGVLLSGIGNILLLLLLFSIAQTDGSFSMGDIGSRLRLLFVGNTIHGVKISLDTVVLCVVLVSVAYYIIRQTKHWIRDRFLPTTQLDIGARTSILSIFTYCSWILVGLGILSIAGLSVQNLTWVVSALSVGIGFGLQSIVQNFVSGMILMAERPVRVGDMVEIAGAKGDVKRISIRATDIGLGDGSTLIVPNSQFITSSVKNCTLSGSTSALTLNFKVPTTTDLEKAKSLLIEVAAQRSEILSNPAPVVRISALASFSLTMSLTVRILSARDASAIQDAILFDVFRRFNAENVTLTTA